MINMSKYTIREGLLKAECRQHVPQSTFDSFDFSNIIGCRIRTDDNIPNSKRERLKTLQHNILGVVSCRIRLNPGTEITWASDRLAMLCRAFAADPLILPTRRKSLP